MDDELIIKQLHQKINRPRTRIVDDKIYVENRRGYAICIIRLWKDHLIVWDTISLYDSIALADPDLITRVQAYIDSYLQRRNDDYALPHGN